MLTFKLLGPLEALDGDTPLNLGGPKQRSVLALLLLNLNRPVSVNDLIDSIWGEEPPDRATATIQVYISNLRKALASAEEADDAAPRIETVTGGYRFIADSNRVDLYGFERLIGLGRASLESGHDEEARTCFERALSMSHGQPGADLFGERVRHEATRLEELRTSALEDRIEADLRLGRGKDLVGEIESLVRAHPYRERLRAHLMVALYVSGRQTEALQAYQDARTLLLDELGIDPGPELRDLEAAILDQTLEIGGGRDGTPTTDDEQPTVRLTTSGHALGALLLPNGERHLLGGEPCTLGRSQSCTVPIDNANMSRRHAVIRHIGDTFTISDLGSTNGTLVNGVPVAEHVLASGDQIDLAGSLVSYEQLGDD